MKILNETLKAVIIAILVTFLIWIGGNIKALTLSRTEPRRDFTRITEVTETPEGDKTITTTTTEEYKNLEVKK